MGAVEGAASVDPVAVCDDASAARGVEALECEDPSEGGWGTREPGEVPGDMAMGDGEFLTQVLDRVGRSLAFEVPYEGHDKEKPSFPSQGLD